MVRPWRVRVARRLNPANLSRKQIVALVLFGLTVLCMSSDQNLMAPNLTAARPAASAPPRAPTGRRPHQRPPSLVRL